MFGMEMAESTPPSKFIEYLSIFDNNNKSSLMFLVNNKHYIKDMIQNLNSFHAILSKFEIF